MINVLSWTGLIVNGTVAFLLPLLLALLTFEARRRSFTELEKLELLEKDSTIKLAKRTLSGRVLALLNSRLSFADAMASGVTDFPMPWVDVPGIPRSRPGSPTPQDSWLVDSLSSPENVEAQQNKLSRSPSKNAIRLLASINPKYEEQDLILDGSVYPLCDFLKPVQAYFVSFILFCFFIGIVFTVVTNTIW